MTFHSFEFDEITTQPKAKALANARRIAKPLLALALTSIAAASALAGGGNNGQTKPIAVLNPLAGATQLRMPYASMWHGTLSASNGGTLVSFSQSLPGPSLSIYNPTNINFSQGGAVAADITNSTGTESDFIFVLHDNSGGSLSYIFSIPANTTQSIALMLCPTTSPAQFGMWNLPTPYPGIVCSPGYAGQKIDLTTVTRVLIAPAGAHPATQLVMSNVRLLPAINWTSYLTGHIDAYGQSTLMNWAGKLTDPSQFATRRAAEESSFGNLLAGQVDSYGGALNLPSQAPTGHFHSAKINGKWWLVTPQGHLFFMNGVDGVDPVKPSTLVSGREYQFASLPTTSDPLAQNYLPASQVCQGATGTAFDFYTSNLQRKYGPNWSSNYLSTFQQRCQTWGLNAIGSYSSSTVTNAHLMPYIKKTDIYGSFNTVTTGSDAHGPMPDPFDPKFQTAAVQQANSLVSLNSDPNLIGFIVNNEPSWTGSMNTNCDPVALGRGTLAQNASSSPAKTELIKELQTSFGTIANLNAAWGTSFSSFTAMNAPLSYWGKLSPGMTASLNTFVNNFANKYYSTLRSAFKAAAPNIMFFGSSLSRFTPGVVAAEAANCDGLAFNMYGTDIWPNITAATQGINLPIISSEWNFTSTSDGLYGAFCDGVANQADRASAYSSYVNMLLTNPNFVGCNFFLYTDYATAGSVDNQQNNVEGLVDVTDTPYAAMVSAIQGVAKNMYQTRWGS
jgi:hypothetical protein